MKRAILFFFFLSLYSHSSDAQIIKNGIADVILIDTESDTFKLLSVFSTRIEEVIYDPVKERVFWNGGFAKTTYAMDRDGGCINTSILRNRDISGAWFLDDQNQEFYYDDNSSISKIAIATTPNPVEILFGVNNLYGIDVDLQEGWIYWIEKISNTVNRVRLDGSGRETLIQSPSGLSDFGGIALDLVNRKLYYVDQGRNIIHRADLDGSNVETLLSGLSEPDRIGVYVPANRLVWTSPGDSTIQMSDLDGNNVEELINTDIEVPVSLSIDPTSGDIYWGDAGFNLSRYERIDGTTFERQSLYLGNLGDYSRLRNDPYNQKVYLRFASGLGDLLHRMNYDGSFPEIVFGERSSEGRTNFTIDGFNGYIYFTSNGNIVRSDLEGENEEVLAAMPSGGIQYMELHLGQNRLYWAQQNGSLGHTDLTSFAHRTVISTENVGRFALDTGNDQIYYHNKTEEQIRRMNTDGTQIEPLAISSPNPRGIGLDVANNRLYWGSSTNNRLFTSELNGFFPMELANLSNDEFIIIGSGSGLLPLVDFTAGDVGQQAALNWTLTADFANNLPANLTFSVQRRQWDYSWKEIGTVAVVNGQAAYSFMDMTPEIGRTNRYRIEYIGEQGDLLYSPTRTLDFIVSTEEVQPSEPADFKLSSNRNWLSVEAKPGRLMLYSMQGVLLGTFEMTAEQIEIPIQSLVNGMYVLEYRSAIEGHRGAKIFTVFNE